MRYIGKKSSQFKVVGNNLTPREEQEYNKRLREAQRKWNKEKRIKKQS